VALTRSARLGPYEIAALIGAGGMGEVYRATDTRLRRTVAITTISDERYDRQDLRERFRSAAIAPASAVNRSPSYDEGVTMTERELADRLAEADRIRAALRRCTLEWQAVGRQILTDRLGPQRPDDGRASGG
jgi:hypothetical protein